MKRSLPSFVPGRLLLALAAALAVLPAAAGIKYWDNQDYKAYDVDCYVPGAVWNLDGIRNVGAAADHDSTALTWKNLGSSGSANDVYYQKNTSGNTFATATADDLAAGTWGEWAADGFVFRGHGRWRRDGSGANAGYIETGTNFTFQMLVDAEASAQQGSDAFPFSAQYARCAIDVRDQSKLIWCTDEEYADKGNAYSSFSSIPGPTFDYITAIMNGATKSSAFFSGTEAPTEGNGFRQYETVTGHAKENGYGIGSTGTGSQGFIGTLKSFRYYKKALSNEEVAWNRVVEEYRFFNRAVPIPVTNAVVATSVAASTEPAGTYAVDGRHVFTAPRVATVGNAKYICTGYTLESWDDTTGDWGSAVFHARELSCAVTDASRVRITWKWMDADGIATYDISDYVWDGLVLFYDGICNVGTNEAHSMTATTWKNLGSAGAVNDMFLQLLNAGGTAWKTAAGFDVVDGRDPGAWTADGFALKGDSRFRVVNTGGQNGYIDTGTDYSLQMLLDAKSADQKQNFSYPFSLSADKYSFIFYQSGNLAWRNDNDGYNTGNNNPTTISGSSFGYVTAIANGTDNTTAFFSGTTIPTSGSGFRRYESITAHGLERGYDLGGYGNANYDRLLVGTIKSFRQYDHALTAAEVEQNRKVDDFRYFGRFAETDVIVQSTHPALQGNEPDGEYDVDGSHTFTAPDSVTIKVNGKEIMYACDGYTVETWGPLADKGDGWSAATHHTGTSYAYTETDGRVRLTWKWKATHGLRTAADYSFSDYSQAGIVWNFDGIYNQGVGVERSTTATTWKNLAPDPVTSELFVQRINSARNNYANSSALSSLDPVDGIDPGEWTADGFRLKGDSRWRGLGQVGPVANWTLQTLVDADVNDIADKLGYLVSVSWSNFAMVLRKQENVPNSLHFNVQNTSGHTTRPYIQNASGKYDYATAILDSSDRTAKMFQGVTPPAGGTIADGYYQFPSSITPFKDTNFGIGASTSYTEYFIGTLKSIRYYDRVLTEEELVRNRNADAARYFGQLGVTNLVVEIAEGDAFDCDPAPGAYYVEGSWTFTASRAASGGTQPSGWRLQDWDSANHRWTNPRSAEELSFTWDAATATAAKQRLMWRSLRPFVLLVR